MYNPSKIHKPMIKLSGRLTPNGKFNVKSLYHSLQPNQEVVNFKWLWALALPPKIKYFLWLIGYNRLPTTAYLYRLNITTSPICPICQQHNETIAHILFNCTHTTSIWYTLGITNDFHTVVNNDDSPIRIIHALINSTTPVPTHVPTQILILFTLWHIWNCRNRKIFQYINV